MVHGNIRFLGVDFFIINAEFKTSMRPEEGVESSVVVTLLYVGTALEMVKRRLDQYLNGIDQLIIGSNERSSSHSEEVKPCKKIEPKPEKEKVQEFLDPIFCIDINTEIK